MTQAFWDDTVPSYQQLVADIGGLSLWDTAYLGQTQVPGVVAVAGEPGRKIDVQSAPGTDGASIVDKGFDPAKPTLKVLLWTPDQWIAYQALLAKYVPKPGKSTQKPTAPIPLTHPGANSVGITAIIITSISIPEPTGQLGVWGSTIKAVQYLKPKKALIVDVDYDDNPITSGIGGVPIGNGATELAPGVYQIGSGTPAPSTNNTGPL